jgi:hypothetical protein
MRNDGATGIQTASAITTNSGSLGTAINHLAVDSTAAQSIWIKMNLVGAATDYMVLEGSSIKVFPN